LRYSHGDGNWINIQYQTKLQAQKALSKSGNLIREGLMVGVMPCTTEKRSLDIDAGPSLMSRVQESVMSSNQASVQPQLFRPASDAYAVVPAVPSNVPRAYGSWWSKFTEYVFGM